MLFALCNITNHTCTIVSSLIKKQLKLQQVHFLTPNFNDFVLELHHSNSGASYQDVFMPFKTTKNACLGVENKYSFSLIRYGVKTARTAPKFSCHISNMTAMCSPHKVEQRRSSLAHFQPS